MVRENVRKTVCQGLTKRDAILQAARQVFLEVGYAAASMDAVAARAGVSKATIYAHFTSKNALFGDVIRARREQALGDVAVPPGCDDPCAALTLVGRRVLDVMLSPESLAMYRVVIAEALRLPEMAEAFYDAAVTPSRQAVAGVLAEFDRRGLLRVPDPMMAADLFFGMLKGDGHLRRMLGLGLGNYAVDDFVAAAVSVMVTAFAVGRG